MIESKPLRHFLAVAQFGNFTQAAKALHMAQPALSISIKKLEQALELILFSSREQIYHLNGRGEGVI